jgi:hypothetical protein
VGLRDAVGRAASRTCAPRSCFTARRRSLLFAFLAAPSALRLGATDGGYRWESGRSEAPLARRLLDLPFSIDGFLRRCYLSMAVESLPISTDGRETSLRSVAAAFVVQKLACR